MAEETIDRAIKAGIMEKKKCLTRKFGFYSNNKHLKSDRLKIYGDQADEIEKIINDYPDLGDLIHPGLPYTRAEIIWMCRNEMPLTVEDMLARRTRALFLDARVSREAGPVVAELMAKELGFNKSWQETEILKYNELVINYL
jgi:glycerol-3-phosphate dehydrogenase